jgi:hypothetical protein
MATVIDELITRFSLQDDYSDKRDQRPWRGDGDGG